MFDKISEKFQKDSNGHTAGSLRRAYESRIDHFLREVHAPSNILGQRDTSLEAVFEWGRQTLNEAHRQQRTIDDYERGDKISKREIDELKKQLERTQGRLKERDAELQRANATIYQMEVRRESLISEHSRNLEGVQNEYDLAMAKLNSTHEQAVYELNEEIKKLVSQLLVNQNDNEGWPDDKLKSRFGALRQLIDSTTSPRNTEFLVPDGRNVGPRLDPTNFIGRVGSGKSHYLLKSAIWKILQEQFFVAPFGFGALGPGKAQGALMNVYFTWRELFEKNRRRITDDDAIALLRHDRTANMWRSATFQTISEAVTRPSSNPPHSQSLVAQLSADNARKTVDRIAAVLLEVSRLSNTGIRPDVKDQIDQIVDISSQIAIQFGVHPAQLRLSFPRNKEQVVIGDDFHDCEDGDYLKGTSYSVDLVTVPGLQKIGDGRSDMSTLRSIVPCEIFPDQT